MKVLVIQHRFDNGDGPYNPDSREKVGSYIMPLGLAYIATVLKKAGNDVTVLNLNNEEGTVKEILRKADFYMEYDIAFVGGLSMFYPHIKDIIENLRQFSKRTLIVVGGGIITAQPEIMFNLLKPDYGVIGEGEQTVVELVKRLESGGDPIGVSGLIFKRERDQEATVVIKTPPRKPIENLDALPFPDYAPFGFVDLLHSMRPYDSGGMYDVVNDPRPYPILASRSCPYNCLEGDTIIDTTSGKFKIKDLVGTLPKVLTRDPITKIPIYAQTTVVAKTGINRTLLRVSFRDGGYIDCTHDHKFVVFLNGGKYSKTREFEVEAFKLQSGDHVRAIHYEVTKQGYVDIVWGRRRKYRKHTLIMETMIGRKLEHNEHIHHIDHDKLNNVESNLVLTDPHNHFSEFHPEISQRMKDCNPSKNLPHEFFVNLGKSQKGKVRSDESRIKYRNSKLGENNPNYKQGLHTGKKSRIPEINHVVENVEILPNKGDTYCLEVPGYDWFYANDVLVHNCTFCFHPLGQKYRQRSIDNIMGEIKQNVKKYKINIVTIYDELFSNDKDRVIEFCTKFKAYSDTLPYKLWFMCNCRVDTTTDEMLKIMKQSGAYLLSFGLESYSQRVLSSMKKHITPEQIDNIVHLLRKNELGLMGSFIFGDVAETCETAKETLDYIKNNRKLLGANVGSFFVIPFQGTPLYKQCVLEGKITDELKFIEDREKNWFKYLEPMNVTSLSDTKFEKLKNEVFSLHLVSDTYAYPSWNTSRCGGWMSVTCPSCGKESRFTNIIFPKGFEEIKVGCRHCFFRFHIVSEWYPLRRLAVKLLGFKLIYRLSRRKL